MHFFISVLLAFSISLSSAQAGGVNDLRAVFDDLSYSLEVEWDQKNEEFYLEQVARFNDGLNELKAQGLTNDEIVAFAVTSVKDHKAAVELEQLFDLMSVRDLSQDQVEDMLENYLSKHYNQGASWIGQTVIIGAGVIVVVAAVMVVNGYDGTHRLTRGTKS